MSKTRSETRLKVDAFLAGKRAWQEDQLSEANNPYPAKSAEWEKWLAGYRAARGESLPQGHI